MFVLVVISVVLTIWWLGIEIAYVYLNHTLSLCFDISLLFFTGNYDYFLLVNGFALYFVLDIVYNRFFSRNEGKHRLKGKEKLNYHHLCSSFEARKGLCRLEFDCSGHLCNVDYSWFEIVIGKLIVLFVLFCLFSGIGDGIGWIREWIVRKEMPGEGLSLIWYRRALQTGVVFLLCGYFLALFHQDWRKVTLRAGIDRLLHAHVRDWLDDVFDLEKRAWNRLVVWMKKPDVWKLNVKGNYRIGGRKVHRRGGFPVLTYRNRIYVNAADCHSLIVATTRAGKSYSMINILVDSLRMCGESMVINDPKGELKESHAARLLEDGYEVYFLDFIHPEAGDCWNPLEVVLRKYRKAQSRYQAEKAAYLESVAGEIVSLKELLEEAENDEARGAILDAIEALENGGPQLDTSEAQEVLNDIANLMTYDEKDANGRFFNSQAGALIVGYANLLLEETVMDPESGEIVPLEDEYIHFKSIKQMSLAGAEAAGKQGETVLSQYLKKHRKPTDRSVVELGQYVHAPGPTKGSIDAVFSDKSRLMTMSESVMRMTSRSTFDLRDISRKKSAVFIIVHGDKNTYYPFVTMFVEQLYQESMAVARENHGRMPYPLNCVFDEAGIMPSLKSIDNMVSFGASAGFRLTMAVQDTSQLDRRYGKEVAHTIMNNMQNFTYLMGGDNETLKTVSEKAGKELVWNREQKRYEEKALLSPERLSSLSMGEAVSLLMRRNPILTRLKGYSDYSFYRYIKKEDISREHPLESVKYFDLAASYKKEKAVSGKKKDPKGSFEKNSESKASSKPTLKFGKTN